MGCSFLKAKKNEASLRSSSVSKVQVDVCKIHRLGLSTQEGVRSSGRVINSSNKDRRVWGAGWRGVGALTVSLTPRQGPAFNSTDIAIIDPLRVTRVLFAISSSKHCGRIRDVTIMAGDVECTRNSSHLTKFVLLHLIVITDCKHDLEYLKRSRYQRVSTVSDQREKKYIRAL